jgi:hypothetical protein
VSAKVEVYQNARIALDLMERDFANVTKTHDMEFFNDTKGVQTSGGHYFPGNNEEIPIWHVTGFDSTASPPKLIVNNHKSAATPESTDLCYYVTEVQFAMFLQNQRMTAAGTYYSAQDCVNPAKMPPKLTDYPFDPLRNVWKDNGAHQDEYEVMAYYDQFHSNSSNTPDWGVLEANENGLFHTNGDATSGGPFMFPMLRPGDKIFLYESTSPPAGSNPFPPGDYTIKKVDMDAKRIEFLEPITMLSFGAPTSTGAGTTRSVTLGYRAAFLPPAVRCVLKIKDAKAKEVRTISRTFKVLAS